MVYINTKLYFFIITILLTYLLLKLHSNQINISSNKSNETKTKDYVQQLIEKCNYPVEIHRNIQTKDGYLLTMHRIPRNSTDSIKTKQFLQPKVPVLLMHGLLGSAEHFLLLNCTKSLPYLLADEGYDVWLANVRSVSYSRYHISLDPDGPEYWQFSYDDFANYDLTKLIDYILATTGQSQIMYIGHSQGNMIFYMMCSNNPEYAKKVQLFINLSPVASLTKMPHPWLTKAANCPILIKSQKWINRTGLYEWTLGNHIVREYGSHWCFGILNGFCKFIIYLFSGLPMERLHNEELRRLLGNCPEGISAKQFIHACQIHLTENLQKFDFGTPEENLEYYGTTEPPKYNLSLTTTPTAIYYAKEDWFLAIEEAEKVIRQLLNVVDSYILEDFSHFEFIIGEEAPKTLYPRILTLMNGFHNNLNSSNCLN